MEFFLHDGLHFLEGFVAKVALQILEGFVLKEVRKVVHLGNELGSKSAFHNTKIETSSSGDSLGSLVVGIADYKHTAFGKLDGSGLERVELNVGGITADTVDRDSLIHTTSHGTNVESMDELLNAIILSNTTGFGQGGFVEFHSIGKASSHAGSDDESRGGGDTGSRRNSTAHADLQNSRSVIL